MFNLKKIISISIVLALVIFNQTPVLAAVMNSANYIMETDAITAGGEDLGNSNNYSLQDTIGGFDSGQMSSENYRVSGGYRLMDDAYLTVSTAVSASLAGTIGQNGGTASGSISWNVGTSNGFGYSLNIKASTTPALQAGTGSISDYAPLASSTPDYDWSTGATAFGFSPYNVISLVSKYKNDGSHCSTGATITNLKCWNGLNTTGENIVNRNSATTGSGEDTIVNFQVQIVGQGQAYGNYQAQVTATAVSN